MTLKQLAAVLLFLAVAAELTTLSMAQGPTPGGCPLMFDFNQANNLSMPSLPPCTAQNVNQALDMCLAPLRIVYGGLEGATGDAQAVVNTGIGNLQCLIQKFFELNQNNFTQYFVFMCQIADYSTKCFNAFQSSCTSVSTDSTFVAASAVLFYMDPLRNLGQMACNGATLKTDVQNFLTTNNLNTCLNPFVRGDLYKKFNDLRNALQQTGPTQMQTFNAVPRAKQMVTSTCGVFGGALGLCNMVALNLTACGQGSMRAMGFLFSALRPPICGNGIGNNNSYASVNAQGITDRINTASNTTFVACWGSGHMVTYSYSAGYMTCGMHNDSSPITLLRLPYTMVESMMLPFNTSTNFTYFASFKVSFYNMAFNLVDYILFPPNATTIQTVTAGGRTQLKNNELSLNQDVYIVADAVKPGSCVMINDVNGRTFIRVCMFVSKQGRTGYYLGLNTLAGYMDQFGSGVLRDGCPNALSISQFGGSYRRRRATDDTATSSTDVSAFSDSSASSMTTDLSTMKTATASAVTSYPSGNFAVKNVAVNSWITFLVSGFSLLVMAVRTGAL